MEFLTIYSRSEKQSLTIPSPHLIRCKYFLLYHPFLRFLDPSYNPDRYCSLSSLLGWSIVMVAARRFRHNSNLMESLQADYLKLFWLAVADIPQPYQVVKALCLICFWPLLINHGYPNFQISGIIMQIALQNMLHHHILNSILSRGNLTESEQHDRLVTWTAYNIVAQRCVVSSHIT